ncbi:cysteine desulfurase mitochondrial-like [Senna tora]|uniref:Cysteine desulfurase mitochondrial-like n=1 Tax=Senna tora TaxID=362788 RepID=A0A834T5R9_9FABA|nr:cysteine desulfurase mitochondrial-like [Senna tora]
METGKGNRGRRRAERRAEISFDEDDIVAGLEECEHCLVGRVLTTKTIHKPALEAALRNIWGVDKGFKVEEVVARTFQFSFGSKEEMDKVMKGGPWIFRNSWLIIQQWQRDAEVLERGFESVRLWVQLWGLPPHCRTEAMAHKIGEVIGNVVDYGIFISQSDHKRFLKVQVDMPVDRPILDEVKASSRTDGDVWVELKYERLAQFCCYCGVVGHGEEQCKVAEEDGKKGVNNSLELGPWVKASIVGIRTLPGQQVTKEKEGRSEYGRKWGEPKQTPQIEALSMLLSKLKMNEEGRNVGAGEESEKEAVMEVAVEENIDPCIGVNGGAMVMNVKKGYSEAEEGVEVEKNEHMITYGDEGRASDEHVREGVENDVDVVEIRALNEIHINEGSVGKENSAIQKENIDPGAKITDVRTWKRMARSIGAIPKGNGRSTRVWDVAWVPGCHPAILERPQVGAEGIEWVSDLLDDSLEWKEDVLRSLFSAETQQRIRSIRVVNAQLADRWSWVGDPRGTFTVNLCYKFYMADYWRDVVLLPGVQGGVENHFWSHLWKLDVLPKHKNFLWRACLGILPTSEALSRRGIDIDDRCLWCGVDVESVFHVLVECPLIQDFWNKSRYDFHSRIWHGSLVDWLKVEGSQWDRDQWNLCTIGLYLLWEARNNRKFANGLMNFEQVWCKATLLLEDILENRQGDVNQKDELERWKRPDGEAVKLNVDAGMLPTNGGILSGVLRDGGGVCIGAFTEKHTHYSNSMMLEAEAIRRGMEVAILAGVRDITVEGDAKLVYEFLCSEDNHTVSPLLLICNHIKILYRSFHRCRFSWSGTEHGEVDLHNEDEIGGGEEVECVGGVGHALFP